MQYYILTTMSKLNIITEQDKNKTFINLCENIIPFLCEANDPKFNEIKPIYEKHYILHLSNLKLLKLLNLNKFRSGFINKLIDLIEKIYDKKVEFNIVKLKKLHFNSDLYTQIVALKLKNRKNRLYKILKSSLNKVNLPLFYKKAERHHKINKDDLLVNNIRNDNINTMLCGSSSLTNKKIAINNVNDSLNSLLINTFNESKNAITNSTRKSSLATHQEYILKSLKHINMRGIRIEVKGRATRRLTASRSVFQMK
jgi:hypothetical protein